MHAAQLGRRYPEFQAANTEVLVILGDGLERAEQYARSLKLPFPVLADPERAVYHEFGLDRALLFVQRTASALVDRQGLVRYVRRAMNPNAWLLESGRLLAAAQQLQAGDDPEFGDGD